MSKRRGAQRRVQRIFCIVVVAGLVATMSAGSAGAVVSGTPQALPAWSLIDPIDVDIEPTNGFLHVTQSTLGAVTVFDASGTWTGLYGTGILDSPQYLDLTTDRIYVTNLGSQRVEYFASSGAHLGGWGGPGSGLGLFNSIGGIEVYNDEVYVADRGNDRVQVFTPNGVWQRQISGAGTAEELDFPTAVSTHDGRLYVVEPERVVVFDPVTGVPIGSFEVSEFSDARAIEITPAGDLFVTVAGLSKVEVYTTAGLLQTEFAQFAYGFAIDPTGRSLWLADPVNDEVVPHTWEQCAGLVPTIVGTSYDDQFTTGSSDDVVFLGAGDDNVRLGSGNDVACGEAGADRIRGEAGSDTLFGGDDDDTLIGGQDADGLNGESGADNLRGGGGDDAIFGGDGPDTIKGQGGGDSIDGGLGDDTIDGQGAADTIDGGPGNDTINGQNGGDVIDGAAGDDILNGQTGPDEFHGDAGDDLLTGGDGADTLYGGPGFDRCSGNTGPDSAEAATCEQTPGVETLF